MRSVRLISDMWAPRDASWYDYPDTRTAKKVHRMNEKSMSYCNPRYLILDDSLTFDGDAISDDRKCKRCLRAK